MVYRQLMAAHDLQAAPELLALAINLTLDRRLAEVRASRAVRASLGICYQSNSTSLVGANIVALYVRSWAAAGRGCSS